VSKCQNVGRCVITQHEGKKKSFIGVRPRESNQGQGRIQSKDQPSTLLDQLYPLGRNAFANNDDLFKIQITTFAENGKNSLNAENNSLFIYMLFKLYLQV